MKSLYQFLLRMLLGLLLALIMLFLVNCSGAPGCPQADFGNSSCSPGGGGIGGGGGGGGGTPAAFAYVVDQNGALDGYGLDPTLPSFGTISSFTPPTLPVNAGGAGVVVAQNQFVYAIFPEAGIQELFGWSKDKNGNLTQLSGFPISLLSLNSITQFTYNQQVLITNPAGTLLFISETADRQILVYQIASDGSLTLAPGSPVSTVSASLTPQNMAMDGNGKFLYVMQDSIDHSGQFVVGYSVTSTGVLTQIPGNWGNSIPIWEMVGDPDGLFMIGITGKVQFLFGSSDKNLYIYKIDQTSGR